MYIHVFLHVCIFLFAQITVPGEGIDHRKSTLARGSIYYVTGVRNGLGRGPHSNHW